MPLLTGQRSGCQIARAMKIQLKRRLGPLACALPRKSQGAPAGKNLFILLVCSYEYQAIQESNGSLDFSTILAANRIVSPSNVE